MFFLCEDKESAKTLYHKLANKLHPDFGGDHDLMVLLNLSYENFIEMFDSVAQMSENLSKKRAKQKYEMSYENLFIGDYRLEIIKEIMMYSVKKPKFNAYYVVSIKDYLDEKGYITSNQYNSLVKNYYAFRMDKEDLSS